MEVILLEKVANLGNLGDKVNIKGGYARNFLLPQGKATVATVPVTTMASPSLIFWVCKSSTTCSTVCAPHAVNIRHRPAIQIAFFIPTQVL